GRADDRVGPGAGAGLAGVALGAGVAVGAGRAVSLVRGGAGAARRITGAGDVALIERGADDGVRAGADAGLAGAALGAEVAVVARREIGQRRVRAAGRGIAAVGGTAVAVVAVGRRTAGAAPTCAGVGRGAGAAVVARRGVVRVRAAGCRVAGVGGADVGVVAIGWRPTRAVAGAVAGVGRRAGVVVCAGNGGEAGDRTAPLAIAHGAGGAGVPVVAGGGRGREGTVGVAAAPGLAVGGAEIAVFVEVDETVAAELGSAAD